jgi:hypothetical protein
VNVGDLKRTDLDVLFFRASIVLGIVIEKHRTALAAANHHSGPTSLLDFLVEKSMAWVDLHTKALAEEDYRGHIGLIRSKIRSDISKRTPALSKILRTVARELKPIRAVRLGGLLQTDCDAVHNRVGEAIESAGSANASERWQQCKSASLRFQRGEPGPTRCSFDRGEPDVITVHIGNHVDSATNPQKGALRTYFNLSFHFFHEYFSHSYALWDDRRHLFAEGFLVWAAQEMMNQVAADKLRRLFISDTLRNRAGKPQVQWAEDAAEWFFRTVGSRFLWYLLEWAGIRYVPENESRVQTLCFLSDVVTAAESTVAAEVRRSFAEGESAPDIHDRLQVIARQSLPFQPYQPRLQ